MIARLVMAGAALAPLLVAFAPAARAIPPPRDEMAAGCADPEDPAHGNRVIGSQPR